LKIAKAVSLVFLAVFLAVSAKDASAKDAKDSGFSGKWILDKHSPRPGDAPNNLDTRIKQDGSGVTIESTFKEPDNGVVPLLYVGLMTSKIRLNTDGQEQETLVGPFTLRTKTTMNGNQILTDWTAQAKDDQVQGHWTHTLSDDGKHMTLEIKEDVPKGQHADATLYFVRK